MYPAQSARSTPETTAVVVADTGETLTYGELPRSATGKLVKGELRRTYLEAHEAQRV